MNETEEETDLLRPEWFFLYQDIQPGGSAVLGNRTTLFYVIHSVGLLVILVSLLGCASVLFNVYQRFRARDKRWDFSDRFPFYLAISDGLWGISNLCGDHFILVTRQVYPEKSMASWLAINVFTFFGYQQLMNAGLSLYTYLKVVRRINIDLGRLEWKLHVSVGVFILLNAVMYQSFGGFGNSGFWFLTDFNTTAGRLLGLTICVTTTIHAVLTLKAYTSIQNVIRKQRRIVSTYTLPPSSVMDMEKGHANDTWGHGHPPAPMEPNQNRYYSTATNCLATFVYISLFLYFPLAIAAWMFEIVGLFGYMEPINILAIVIGANSGGWVNALGYFHNKNIKKRRYKVTQGKFHLVNASTPSSSA